MATGLGQRMGLHLGWVAVLVPLATAALYAGPNGIKSAEGCSGAGPFSDGWTNLALARPDGETVARVATDGFFVIKGTSRNLRDAAAVSSVQVQVTTDTAQPVPGTVSLLRNPPGANSEVLLGWSATNRLQVGAKLTVAISTTEPAEYGVSHEQVALTVVAEPTTLAPGKLEFSAWVDFRHGVGDPVACLSPLGYCGPTRTLPNAELKQHAVDTRWQPVDIQGYVAWQADLVLVGEPADGIVPSTGIVELFASAEPVSPGRLVFPSKASKFCASLRVRDLRTGDQQESPVLCAEPGPATSIATDTALSTCTSAPNQALTETWCKLKGVDGQGGGCFGYPAGGTGGGPSGSGGGPSAGGTSMSGPVGAGDVSSAGQQSLGALLEPKAGADGSDDARTSRGCQLGGLGGGGAGAVGLLLSLFGLSRCRSRRMRTAVELSRAARSASRGVGRARGRGLAPFVNGAEELERAAKVGRQRIA